MKSNESFIEAVLEKEKLKRAQIKAARRRTVGICTSLALCFVIGLSAVNVIGLFSANKSADSAAPESANTAPSLKGDAMFDENTDADDEESEPGDGANGAVSDNVYESEKKPNAQENSQGTSLSTWPDVSYGSVIGAPEAPKSDTEASAQNKNEGIESYWYVIIASVAILVVLVVFCLVKKRR